MRWVGSSPHTHTHTHRLLFYGSFPKAIIAKRSVSGEQGLEKIHGWE